MDELDIINLLDSDQADWVDDFVTGLTLLANELLEELERLLDRLALRGRATTAEEMRANLRAVTMWQADLPALLDRLGWPQMVNTFVGQMGTSADRLTAYFRTVDPAFSNAAYTDLVERVAAQTRTLLTSALEVNVSRALNDTLSWHVLTKATSAELRTVLRETLAENSLPLRAVEQLADDALHQFSRGYSVAVAEDLNLRHWYYMGTRIATTRDFCDKRYGRAYTQAEVEGWADLSWSGKMPGTTATTIFWYCGGWRCRHRLLPISARLYRTLTTQINK